MTTLDQALDIERIAAAPVTQSPYPHAIIKDSILPAAAKALARALPSVTEHGSLRFNEIDRSPELDALIAELESDRFRALMEAKFDIGPRRNDPSLGPGRTPRRAWNQRQSRPHLDRS